MIILAYDHGGYEKFKIIKKYLEEKGLEYKEYASLEYDGLDNFTVFSSQANNAVLNGNIGIYGCRSGIGMSIASNRVKGIRGALCFQPIIAEMSRKHNDANVCIIPCDYSSNDQVIDTVEKFLNTEFLGGKYQDRVEELDNLF